MVANKILIGMIKKVMDNPKKWHEVLSEVFGPIEILNALLLVLSFIG